MNATELKSESLQNYKITKAVEKTFDDMIDASVEGKFYVHYSENQNGLTGNDYEYLRSLGYKVQWAERNKLKSGHWFKVLEVMVSWGETNK